MRLAATPEMKELRAIYTPYVDKNNQLKKDAPEEAKKAKEEYLRLFGILQEQAEHEAGWDTFFK